MGGAEQALGVILQPENGRTGGGFVSTHTFKDTHAVVQRVGQNVCGGFAPGDEFSVIPDDAVTIGHGHGVELRVYRKKDTGF